MPSIDQYRHYIDSRELTQNDLSGYSVECKGHLIGDRYVEDGQSGIVTLVEITDKRTATLVSDGGIAKNVDIDWLDESFRYVERGLPWLTWRFKPGGPYFHGPLSNFWIEFDGLSLEHRFAALKTDDIKAKLEILCMSKPGEAKKLGRLVSLRVGWDEHKRFLMRDLLAKKFLANPYPRKYLIATKGAYIREKNNWNDTIWGVNLQGRGRNLLGKELMLLREVLNDDG